jgi:hypothetical protein
MGQGPNRQNPQLFNGAQNLDQQMQGAQRRFDNQAARTFGNYNQLLPQLSPQGQGQSQGPNVRKWKEDPGVQITDPSALPETGPQAFGSYAPDIQRSQFGNENFAKKGTQGVSTLGYGFGSGMGGFGGLMGMMGGGMGGLDPNLLMLLLGQMGGGPLIGR